MATDETPAPFAGQCTAKSSRTGERCRARAIRGGTVCVAHGGRAPQVKAAAARRVAQAEAVAILNTMGRPVEVGPLTALVQAVQEAAGNVVFLRDRVQALDPTFGEGAHLVGPNHLGDGAPHVWLALYNEALDRLAKISAAAVRAGVDVAQVRIAEQQGELLAQAMRGLLARLGVEVTAEVRAAMREELVAVSAAGTDLEGTP